MAKTLEPGIVEMIQDCYKDDWKTIEIHEFFQDEFSLNIPYKTIWGRHPEVMAEKIEYRKSYCHNSFVKLGKKKYMKGYMREYNKRPDVIAKQKIRKNLKSCILSVFDSELMSVNAIHKRLEERFSVNFSKTIEDKIDKTIQSLGKDSPIICTGNHQYKLIKNAGVCGKPIED